MLDLKLIDERQLVQWVNTVFEVAKLLLELSLTGSISFLFVCGTTALATSSMSVGVASGMISAAVCMAALFRQSELTRNWKIVLPAMEAGKEMDAQLQSIERK